MGTAALAALVVAVALTATTARADSCTGISSSGAKFETCFDLGNRLSLTAGSDGFGGSIQLRQIIKFDDDPDLEWKLEHEMVHVETAKLDGEITGVVYGGRFIRHTRDGHIVLPLGTPKKIFLPFDIGAVVEAGRVRIRDDAMGVSSIRIGIVKTAPVVDLWRTRDFKRRLEIGPVARWDIDLSRDPLAVGRHIVAPFSTGLANLHLESRDGLLSADFAVEGGTMWTSDMKWVPVAQASASIERIVMAINDRPIALVVGVKYDHEYGETLARIGARIVLFHANDTRVGRL